MLAAMLALPTNDPGGLTRFRASDWTSPSDVPIASHLPRAPGVAFAIDRARRLDCRRWSRDASLCAFGEREHSTAQGA